MDAKQIIMHFTTPPGLNDFETIAQAVIEGMPDELEEYCDDLQILVEDFPDEVMQSDLEVDDPYELLALFRSGKELSPGVEKKEGKEEDVLLLFRRPILDLWCENCEDITALIREIIIDEVARANDFNDDEIEEMSGRHNQQVL